LQPTSPNHALQRTAPCVTAPASAAAFPPTMQVPRRTPLSLSLRSLGRLRTRHENCAIHLVTVPVAGGSRDLRAPHACRARTAYRRCPPTRHRHWTMDCHSLRTHRRLVVLVVAGRLGLAGAVHHLLRRLRLPAHSSDAAAEYGVAVRDGVGAESRLRAGATETDDFSLEHMRDRRPNHALQRTRPSRSRSSPRCSWAGSLSLGSLGD